MRPFLFGLDPGQLAAQSLRVYWQRTKRSPERPINFVAVCPPAIKIRELELRKLVRQCHRDVKTCFFFLLHTEACISWQEKSRGDSILDNRTMATTTTLCDHSRTNCVCVRALEGESECNRVLVHTAWHRDTST